MADSQNKKEAGDEKAWLVAAGMCVGLLVAVPAMVAVPIWLGLRRRLTRGEWLMVAGTAVVVLVLARRTAVTPYFSWLGGLIPPGVDWWPIPVLSIVAWAVLLAAIVGAIEGTATFSKVADKLHLAREEDDSIVPTGEARSWIPRSKPKESPVDMIRIDASEHSADFHELGSRQFGIGLDKYGQRPVLLSEREIGTHMVLVGATGSGKTTTLKTLIGQLGDLGWSVIMLDLKEDTAPGGLRDFIREYAVSHAQRYQEITLSGGTNQYWFNPLRGMGTDEAINTILSLQEFDDGHWQAINRTLIGQAVTLFYDAHEIDPERFEEPDMYAIGKVLGGNFTQQLKERIAIVIGSRPDRTKDDFSALSTPSDDHRKSAAGLSSRIINMYESNSGRQVLRGGDGRIPMDVTDGGFVYVGLNTLGLSELARCVSTSALLRISAAAGQRTTGVTQGQLRPTAVIVDEANWIDRMSVKNLLSRARSAGIMVALATQGPLDWIDEHGNDWDTITQNTNVSIIMKQGNEASAELCADLIGKKEKTSIMSQVRDGEVLESGSQRSIIDHVVPPHEIRRLGTGEAIVKVATPERIEYVRVAMRGPNERVGA
jgi:energy-coupling factor transporter ATP-binding protein EcfA2